MRHLRTGESPSLLRPNPFVGAAPKQRTSVPPAMSRDGRESVPGKQKGDNKYAAEDQSSSPERVEGPH